MRKLFFVFITFSFACLFSCSDGDIIDVELDFDGDFSVIPCGTSDLVFYKTKSDPSESLSLVIKSLTLDGILSFKGADTTITKENNVFNYRTYSNEKINGNDLFCNDIPPSDIIITNSYDSTCDAEIKAMLIEDDNDGIPAALEDENLDGDNDPSTNPTDTDKDGLPNYIDADDDGDNVLTKDEDLDKDGDFTNDDTDGDSIPNYLDNDDDGDGVKTRDEETSTQNQNPIDDTTNNDVGPDYLNKDVANTNTPATAYRTHTISKTYVIDLNLKSIDLEILSQDFLDFGKLSDSNIDSKLKSRTVTPDFN